MGVENGEIPTVRGVIMCKACKHWQSWISYSMKKKIQGRRRRSDCMKCNKRNQFRIEPKYHRNKSPVKFVRTDNNLDRKFLVELAQSFNRSTSKLEDSEGLFKTAAILDKLQRLSE